jgi:hypothetical protein
VRHPVDDEGRYGEPVAGCHPQATQTGNSEFVVQRTDECLLVAQPVHPATAAQLLGSSREGDDAHDVG